LVSGEPPFSDPSPVKVMMAQMKDPPPPLRQRRPGLSLPAGYEDWLLVAMAKNPDERFAEATAMRDQLRRIVAGQGLSVPAPKAAAPAPAPASPATAQRPAPGAAPAAKRAGAEARPAAHVVVPEPAAQGGGSWKLIAIAAVGVAAVVAALLALR
jgi:serine/threonine-protein kinase